ncbi:MAG TPA: ABC transporter permease [Arenimonas sp.]|uniref:ABC transporter permease n=1 Tax=Arenimonas sp. TaxID=1872635 RepID=UPI002D7FF82A|nr:ABC transporter permease [Arenimonas sp.]HEU0151714.1 ABC transporter permease [Arenimonas sp.]
MNPHSQRATGLPAAAASLWTHARLLRDLTWREISGRYRGSWLGITWSILTPLMMLAVYTFVFSVVFGARWSAAAVPAGKFDFALFVFVGVLMHGILAEAITRAPGLVLGNANYVKKVIFPLELLPVTVVGAAAFHAAIALGILLAGVLVLGGGLSWAVLWLPLLMLPLLVLSLGLAWGLAALGVFLRDTAQVTGVLASVLMFLAPVFYPVSALPASVRGWLFLNPLTFVIEQARGAIFAGQAPDLALLALFWGIALAVAQAGFWFFQKSRSGFADVL